MDSKQLAYKSEGNSEESSDKDSDILNWCFINFNVCIYFFL